MSIYSFAKDSGPRSVCHVLTSTALTCLLLPQGITELKVFVDLASISAGENDIDVDRVACFHDAVQGYSPLLYKLDTSVGFDELMTHLKELWKALENDQHLPSKLVSFVSPLQVKLTYRLATPEACGSDDTSMWQAFRQPFKRRFENSSSYVEMLSLPCYVRKRGPKSQR